MEEQINIIACIPCLEGIQLGFVPYKGSEIIRCEKCNCRVWLGPTCKDKKEKDGLPIWCMKCVLKEYGPEAAGMIKTLTNKQMGE